MGSMQGLVDFEDFEDEMIGSSQINDESQPLTPLRFQYLVEVLIEEL